RDRSWLPKEWLELLPSLTEAAEREPFYRMSMRLSDVDPDHWSQWANSIRQWEGVMEVIYGRNTFELFSQISNVWRLIRHYMLWGFVGVGVAVAYWLSMTWYKLMQEELGLLRSFGASWSFFLWPSALFFLLIQGGAWLVTAMVWFALSSQLADSLQQVAYWLGGQEVRIVWQDQVVLIVLGSLSLFLALFMLIQFFSLRRLILASALLMLMNLALIPASSWAESSFKAEPTLFYGKQKVEFELESIWLLKQQIADKKKSQLQMKGQLLSGLRRWIYQSYVAQEKDKSYLFQRDDEEMQERERRVMQQSTVFWAIRKDQSLNAELRLVNEREQALRTRELYLRRVWQELARQYRLSQEELQTYTEQMMATRKVLLASPHWQVSSPFLVAPFAGQFKHLGLDPELGSVWVLLGSDEQLLILWSQQVTSLGADRDVSSGEVLYPQVISDLGFELRIWNQIVERGSWQSRRRVVQGGG
ncbi:MAG: hypothetical protein N2Z70_01545, partial [Bdellovibrionaceae bacterium]|nr:hypothetical protein [Pseudobdellovibrionaceae bacterium]